MSGGWTSGNANISNLYCGMRYNEFVGGVGSYHFPDGSPRPGTGDSAQRLREQDFDGIDAEVLIRRFMG